MWALKLKLDSEKQVLGKLAIKHNVSLTGYPLSYYKDKKNLYLISGGIVFGDEENKKELIKDLKKSENIVNFEQSGDFVINVSKQPLYTEVFYNSEVIRPNPVIINKQGFHFWHLASFDRKILEKILDVAEKELNAKIISFKQEKVSNINFTRLFPELSKNQKKAMEIAINSGYYDYPKKIKMEELAKKMKISYSTFQAHLKKAEGKIVPSVFRDL
jgi:predicted DNA binding protein